MSRRGGWKAGRPRRFVCRFFRLKTVCGAAVTKQHSCCFAAGFCIAAKTLANRVAGSPGLCARPQGGAADGADGADGAGVGPVVGRGWAWWWAGGGGGGEVWGRWGGGGGPVLGPGAGRAYFWNRIATAWASSALVPTTVIRVFDGLTAAMPLNAMVCAAPPPTPGQLWLNCALKLLPLVMASRLPSWVQPVLVWLPVSCPLLDAVESISRLPLPALARQAPAASVCTAGVLIAALWTNVTTPAFAPTAAFAAARAFRPVRAICGGISASLAVTWPVCAWPVASLSSSAYDMPLALPSLCSVSLTSVRASWLSIQALA